tara:strand:- start:549 stop:1448 length:900 start_codon:yes stop_codon:yes gene_type:complete
MPLLKSELDEARELTKARVDDANTRFGLQPHGNSYFVIKIVQSTTSTLYQWAKEKIHDGVVPLTPYDREPLRDDVAECRSTKATKCAIDASCTTPRGNTTLFMSDATEWKQKARNWDIDNIAGELGLSGLDVDKAGVICLELFDGNKIRVPCARIPSINCPEGCNYGSNFPKDLCDVDTFQAEYPALAKIIAGQKLCKGGPDAMPFNGLGETPNKMREFVIHMGEQTEARVVFALPLRECLEKIKDDDLLIDLRGGGGNKSRKHKTKKKGSKKKRSKKKRSKKKRSKKKRSKKRRPRKY